MPQYRKDFYSQFDDMIRWYEKFLVELRESAENEGHSIELNRFLKSTDGKDSSVNESQDTKKLRDIVSLPRGNHKPNSTISDTQAIEEMTKCLSVESEEDQVSSTLICRTVNIRLFEGKNLQLISVLGFNSRPFSKKHKSRRLG